MKQQLFSNKQKKDHSRKLKITVHSMLFKSIKSKALVISLIICMLSSVSIAQNINKNIKSSVINPLFFDYSELSWADAFDSLNACISERYPFTEWKNIDWDQKKSYSLPKIQIAQNESDTIKLIEALYEYLYTVPDGHIQMFGNVDKFKKEKYGGCYGFNMLPISNEKIIVNIVEEEGPAFEAGIRIGDIITSWNGISILEVSEMESYNNLGCISMNYATLEGRLISFYEILSRDPIGTQTNITYISHETEIENTITLTAVDDNSSVLLQAFFLTSKVNSFEDIVFYEILDQDIGYLRVLLEDCDSLTMEGVRSSETYLEVKEAITYFNENGVNKLIFDLRLNMGGNDILGAAISGFFVDEPMFYENISGNSDDDFAVIMELFSEVEQPHYDGTVVGLVGPNCISTGEGIPMMFKKLPKAEIISFWGTNGSFGITPNTVLMPEGLVVNYPFGRSLDQNLEIQLDTNEELIGGIQPDTKLPLTVERVIKQWEEGIDVELEYAKSFLLSIEEVNIQNECILYPNPVSDYLNIKKLPESKDDYNVSLYNVQGQLVYNENLKFDKNQVCSLNLKTLNNGVYICSISNGLKKYHSKIIIKH